MKHYTFLFFFFLILQSSNAQESPAIDSLKARIKVCKTDSSRSYEDDVLAKEYSEINPDSGLIYAARALALAKKINKYQYQVDAHISFGIIYRERGEFNTALDNLNAALKIAQDHKLEGKYFERIYASLNLAYTEQGNYTVGLEYGFKALHEIEKGKDTLAMALSNNNIANTYFGIKQYRKAMKYYSVALNYAVAIKELYGQSLLTGNIGSVYYEMGELDSLKYFLKDLFC